MSQLSPLQSSLMGANLNILVLREAFGKEIMCLRTYLFCQDILSRLVDQQFNLGNNSGVKMNVFSPGSDLCG